MNKKDLLTEFFQKQNYDFLKSALASSKDPLERYCLARVYMKENDYKNAGEIYRSLGKLYEYGRCLLFQGKLEKTRALWTSLAPDTPAVLWGCSLLEFIDMYVVHLPTFFQIRSFLEMDLDALLTAGQIKFAENIINGADLFAKTNTESYKFFNNSVYCGQRNFWDFFFCHIINFFCRYWTILVFKNLQYLISVF